MTSFREALTNTDEIKINRDNMRKEMLKEDIIKNRKSYLNTLFIGSLFTYILFYTTFSPILVEMLVPIFIDTLPNPSTVIHVYGVKRKAYFVSSFLLPITISFLAFFSHKLGETQSKIILINFSYPIYILYYTILIIFFIPIKIAKTINNIIERFL